MAGPPPVADEPSTAPQPAEAVDGEAGAEEVGSIEEVAPTDVVITDALGREITMEALPQRVPLPGAARTR